MMVFDHQQQRLTQLRLALSTVVTPFTYLVDLPVNLLREGAQRLQTHHTLMQENIDLKQTQLLLSIRLQRLLALETENKRLRLLLDSAAVTKKERVLVAEILKVELDPFSHRVTLNKGYKHDVYAGQPVVDAYGIMGQVIEVGFFDSVALLITDMNHAIPVQSNRSGARAVATGSGNYHELILTHVTTTADIKVGDLLVTSGLGGNFPQGYPVAFVEAVEAAPGETFAKVIAKPVAQLDKTREVLLLWSEPETQVEDRVLPPSPYEKLGAKEVVSGSATTQTSVAPITPAPSTLKPAETPAPAASIAPQTPPALAPAPAPAQNSSAPKPPKKIVPEAGAGMPPPF